MGIAREDGLVDGISRGLSRRDTHESGNESNARCACMYASRIHEVVDEEVDRGWSGGKSRSPLPRPGF